MTYLQTFSIFVIYHRFVHKRYFQWPVQNHFQLLSFTTNLCRKGTFSDLFTNFFSFWGLSPICSEIYFQWPVYKLFQFLVFITNLFRKGTFSDLFTFFFQFFCFTTDFYRKGTFSDQVTKFFSFCVLPLMFTYKVLSMTCLQTFSIFVFYHRFVQKMYFQWLVYKLFQF